MSNSPSNSEVTNSLIGFLTKQSLFSNPNSPRKAPTNKKSSSSKQSKDVLNLSSRADKRLNNNRIDISSKSYISEIPLFRDHSQKQFDNGKNNNKFFSKQQIGSTDKKMSQVRYQAGDRFNKRNNTGDNSGIDTTKPTIKQSNIRNTHSRNPQIQNSFFKGAMKSNTHNTQSMFNGLVNQNSNFQSARIQSAQCLEELSMKLHNQISNINYKIDMFNTKMSKALNIQFKNLRNKINQIVEDVFQQSQQSISQYMRQQQAILAKQLIQMKTTLEKQYTKVESMKEDISGSAWRKAAGELLSSELEQRIEQSLKQSKTIEVSHWQLGDLGGNKITNLENQLKDIVCLVR